MRELETETDLECGENSAEDTGSSSQETMASLEQLDLLFEKEQGVVRRAGWLTFKPLLTLHKDRKIELVPRRRWKQYWVTLKGTDTPGTVMCNAKLLNNRLCFLV